MNEEDFKKYLKIFLFKKQSSQNELRTVSEIEKEREKKEKFQELFDTNKNKTKLEDQKNTKNKLLKKLIKIVRNHVSGENLLRIQNKIDSLSSVDFHKDCQIIELFLQDLKTQDNIDKDLLK